MVRVELVLNGCFEMYFVPGVAKLDWVTNNILALEYVFDQLKQRRVNLDNLQISARNPEFDPAWNSDWERRI